MAVDYGKPPKVDKKHVREDPEAAELEFEKLVLKNIPCWTAIWSMLLMESKEMSRRKKYDADNPVDLQKKIRRKISELVDNEEILVNLYKEAAEVAKKKEEEFKGKTAILIQQIEKDKNLMNELKNVN